MYSADSSAPNISAPRANLYSDALTPPVREIAKFAKQARPIRCVSDGDVWGCLSASEHCNRRDGEHAHHDMTCEKWIAFDFRHKLGNISLIPISLLQRLWLKGRSIHLFCRN